MTFYSAAEMDALAGMHVARAWFLELYLPSGLVRLHTGAGKKKVDGEWWRGVSNPPLPSLTGEDDERGQLVLVSSVREPRFGRADYVDIVLSGADREFFKSIHDLGRSFEGVRADLYFGMFDGESEKAKFPLTRLFPGRLTSPKLEWAKLGGRTIFVKIESDWSSGKYPIGRKWNNAAQQKEYPGDKGFDQADMEVTESLK